MKPTTDSKKQKYPLVSLKPRPKLYIHKDLINLVTFFHNQTKKGDEWSGILFYDVKGTISDPENLELTAKTAMIKDMGTASYTSYEFGPDLFDFFDEVPEAEELKMGHIHSHHTMDTFFSSTDNDELAENAPNHNYYLSLIVNYRGTYNAKLAVKATIPKTQAIIKDEKGEPVSISTGEDEVVFVYDCDLIFLLDQYNIDACKELKKPKTYTPTTYTKPKEYTKPKNQLGDGTITTKQAEQIFSAVLYIDTEGVETKNIPWRLAAYRLGQMFIDQKEADDYLDAVDQNLQEIVETLTGDMSNTEELADSWLFFLEDSTLPDTYFKQQLSELIKFYSSSVDEMLDDEELVITKKT